MQPVVADARAARRKRAWRGPVRTCEGGLRRMFGAVPRPRSPGVDGAVGYTPRQHRVYDELVTRSGSRGPDPDHVRREPGGARDDCEIWQIMQDEEDGVRSPSPGRQHFLTRRHSPGRFPHQWPTPWRDKPAVSRWVDGQDANEAHGTARTGSNESPVVETSDPSRGQRLTSAKRALDSPVSNKMSKWRDTLVAASQPRVSCSGVDTTGGAVGAPQPVFQRQHICDEVLVSKTVVRKGRQRFWAGRAIEKLVCTDGKMIDNYVTYRKARGEDKIIIAHWKGQKFYEDLSKDSGISLPKTWGGKLPMLCESCFADYVAAMRVHQRSLSNVY